uniref:Grh/CP2 DB domain-containing protein n=1 Tax=Macrostomum lignano TaxID=282301 RepID=A0A1I8GL17_9PLAT
SINSLANPKPQRLVSDANRHLGDTKQQQQQQAMSEWQMDDIDHGLAANFEGSLSGLGVDLAASSFNMSEAIMSLSPGKFLPPTDEAATDSSSFSGMDNRQSESMQQQQQQPPLLHSDKFNISMCACTSPAIKVNEEPLTYLNQGHPYEVKLSYYGNGEKSRLFRSVFRISFHERRMQFMEKEHLDYWRQSRPGERILDIDIPLSYNLSDVKISPAHINMAEVIWEGGKSRVGDSSSDCGVFVKLHCISTEFTARKHGGEKGIPFRLQVDTFDNATGNHLQSLAAQVKVFKPKGADRKHKTDREKVEKRTESERSKYQPSLLYTPFKPTVYLSEQGLLSLVKPELKSAADRPADGVVVRPALERSNAAAVTAGLAARQAPNRCTRPPAHPVQQPPPLLLKFAMRRESPVNLTFDSSPQQVADWLEQNRFATVARLFANFNGADLLRLSRADLIEICGPSDGVRLYNGLAQRPCRYKLLFYVGQESEN